MPAEVQLQVRGLSPERVQRTPSAQGAPSVQLALVSGMDSAGCGLRRSSSRTSKQVQRRSTPQAHLAARPPAGSTR
jgi:hypothetical protein